jgi:adenine-specific DNA-methyltransferase
MAKALNSLKAEKKVTRYTYNDVKEPRTPETGHTPLLPSDEHVVTLPMDNGWSKAVVLGKLPEGHERPVVVDMDPAADPVLFWAGKRNRREVPVLPLQRNEIVSESRIAQIIERARRAAEGKSGAARQGHLFADLEKTLRESDRSKRVNFYTYEEGWKNKLICGDSLHVMESLLHYENLRGKVQMIYIDPPYGIKYDSNFQQRVDSTKNDDNDQADDVVTIKAFRDTWTLGPHSYLSYLQERLYLCRELLAETGSIFLQINDTNSHIVRTLLDEVFGSTNFVSQIAFTKTTGLGTRGLPDRCDYLLWYGRDSERVKYRQLYLQKVQGEEGATQYDWVHKASGEMRRLNEGEMLEEGDRLFHIDNASAMFTTPHLALPFTLKSGKTVHPPKNRQWQTTQEGLRRLDELNRLLLVRNSLRYVRYLTDFPVFPLSSLWVDTGVSGFGETKVYAVQTNSKVVSRCIQMTTDPCDLVFAE